MFALSFMSFIVQIISYKNGDFGTSTYFLTRNFGFYQTTEYGISLKTIMDNIAGRTTKAASGGQSLTASRKATESKL